MPARTADSARFPARTAPEGIKPAPTACLEAGRCSPLMAGRGRGGWHREAGPYVHTDSNISQTAYFESTTAQGRVIDLRERGIKRRADLVRSLNACGREAMAKSMANCGETFDVWYRGADGSVKILPCPCNSMLCTECARRRSVPLQKKLLKLVNRPKRSYWFLTFSAANQPDLSHWDIQQLGKKCGQLQESWVFRQVEGPDGKPWSVFGGARSIEATYNQGFRWNSRRNENGKWISTATADPSVKGWHPHVHYLLEMPAELPDWWLVLLKTEIRRLFGEYVYVHLSRAYGVTKRGTKMHGRLNMKALKELCKYVTKSSSFAADHLLVDEFLTAFRGVRRIQCFGSFFGDKAKGEREPGDEDEDAMAEEKLQLKAEGYRRLPIRAYLVDTVLAKDGTRQLTFAFLEKVRAHVKAAASPPPWMLEPQEFSHVGQTEFGDVGTLPEVSEPYPSLFDAAA